MKLWKKNLKLWSRKWKLWMKPNLHQNQIQRYTIYLTHLHDNTAWSLYTFHMITYPLQDSLEKNCFRMSNLHYELENRLKLDSSVSANSRIARRKEVRILKTTVTIVGLAKADKSYFPTLPLFEPFKENCRKKIKVIRVQALETNQAPDQGTSSKAIFDSYFPFDLTRRKNNCIQIWITVEKRIWWWQIHAAA